MNRPVLVLLTVFLAVADAPADNSGLPYYQDKSLAPMWADQLDGPQHRVGSFSLVNQKGEVVTDDSLGGKIRIVNFFFATCPGICPTTMRQLDKVQGDLDASRAVMLSFSITPNIDTAERLAEYATAQQIDAARWQLLTGETDQITRVAQESYFAVLERNVDKNAFVHTEKAFLVDQDGFIRGVYNATSPADVMRLTEDLQQLSMSNKLN